MKKLVIIIVTSLAWSFSYCQQDPVFTQFIFNKLPVNPAYAGSTEALSLDIIDRFQWVGFTDGPNTLSFTANSNLPNKHLGVGLFAYRDALGPTVESGVMGSFAYRIILPKGNLGFGVQFGYTYMDIDWTALNPEDPNDPMISNQVKNQAAPDAGVGIYFQAKNWYAGISSTHLIQNKMAVTTLPTDETSFSKLLRHFYAMGGVAIPLNDYLVLRPTALVKYVQNAPLQADLNVSLLIKELIWIGLGYRTEQCLSIYTEVNIAKNLHIGYSYDAWFNYLVSYNKGSHEIRIGYDLDIFHTSRYHVPRYF